MSFCINYCKIVIGRTLMPTVATVLSAAVIVNFGNFLGQFRLVIGLGCFLKKICETKEVDI